MGTARRSNESAIKIDGFRNDIANRHLGKCPHAPFGADEEQRQKRNCKHNSVWTKKAQRKSRSGCSKVLLPIYEHSTNKTKSSASGRTAKPQWRPQFEEPFQPLHKNQDTTS
jgi:hypothetical protein